MGKRGPEPLPPAEHARRGHWRADRHAEPEPSEPGDGPAPSGSQPGYAHVSDADREAVLSELSGSGYTVAADWLELYVGWDQLALHLLKHIGLSASRLDALVEDSELLQVDEIRKEIQCYCTLIRTLRSEE